MVSQRVRCLDCKRVVEIYVYTRVSCEIYAFNICAHNNTAYLDRCKVRRFANCVCDVLYILGILMLWRRKIVFGWWGLNAMCGLCSWLSECLHIWWWNAFVWCNIRFVVIIQFKQCSNGRNDVCGTLQADFGKFFLKLCIKEERIGNKVFQILEFELLPKSGLKTYIIYIVFILWPHLHCVPSIAPYCSSIFVIDRLLLSTATSSGDNPSLFKLVQYETYIIINNV